jgi:hypothetical protein
MEVDADDSNLLRFLRRFPRRLAGLLYPINQSWINCLERGRLRALGIGFRLDGLLEGFFCHDTLPYPVQQKRRTATPVERRNIPMPRKHSEY